MMTEMDDPMVLESLLPYPKDLDRSVSAARAREMQEDVLLYKEAALQPTGRCVQGRLPAEMRTEMDDPMVLESNLAARAREKQEAVSRNGVSENSVIDSPASGAMEATEPVVGMESSAPALTYSPVGDDMSKHGDGAQTESPQEQELALPTKPSEGGRVIELLLESLSFLSPNSGKFNDIAVEGTIVAQKKCRIRGKNWGQKDTDDVLGAVLNTPKVCSRMEQGTDSDPYWDAVAKAVPGRTGHECRGRMDTLKRSFSTMKEYCDGQGKEFKQLNEMDFGKMKVSPRLTEAWYNHVRDYCPPRPKKKLKTNGAGSSSKSTGFVPDTSTSGLPPPVVPDGIDQGEPAMVDPPASQLELPVADPAIQRPAPPAPDFWDELDSLSGAAFEFRDEDEGDSIEPLLWSFEEDSCFNTEDLEFWSLEDESCFNTEGLEFWSLEDESCFNTEGLEF